VQAPVRQGVKVHAATLRTAAVPTAIAVPDRRVMPSPAALPLALPVRRVLPDASVPATLPGRRRECRRDQPASAGMPSALHLRDDVRGNRSDLPSAVHGKHGNDGHAGAWCIEPVLDRVSASVPPASVYSGRGLPDVRLSGRPADPTATMPGVQRRQPVLPVPRIGHGLTVDTDRRTPT
jgi:hypothetical protein